MGRMPWITIMTPENPDFFFHRLISAIRTSLIKRAEPHLKKLSPRNT